MPGANKHLTYTIIVGNEGQPAINLPITVTDQLPANTVPGSVGPGGEFSQDFVSFTQSVNLDTGETTSFVFSIDVSNVSGGTLSNGVVSRSLPELGTNETAQFTFTVNIGDEIVNDDYSVTSAEGVSVSGPPVITVVVSDDNVIYMPILVKK